jgi:hypothetical protein
MKFTSEEKKARLQVKAARELRRDRRELSRMLVLENHARNLSQKLSKVQIEWETLRDSQLLESDTYREYCDKGGIARHYSFGDVLA